MQRVYSAPALPEAQRVGDLLRLEGIPCTIRGQYLGVAAGELPPTECWPAVWVFDDGDAPRARELVRELQAPASAQAGTWTCPQCGEELEMPFDTCWNCGAGRPESV
ncbi:MAG: DUF2007 domain-containing protein [Candidatus Latescibacterota bacterium]